MPEPRLNLAGLLTPQGASFLMSPQHSAPTRALGGLLGAYFSARDYNYPDTALGMAALPAKAATAIGRNAIGEIQGAMQEAPEVVFADNPGAKTTNIGLGLLGVGGILGNAPRGILGANVFQGGPSKYGPEGAAKSLDYIGKGEGAQAYGYGRYDAEAEEVGKQYKEFLGTRNADLTDPGNRAASAVYRTPEGTVEAGIQEIKAAIRAADNYPNAFPKGENELNKQALSYLESGKELPSQEGYLYKHDLPDEDIARYLDWDAPLSEQPESVRAGLPSLLQTINEGRAERFGPEGRMVNQDEFMNMSGEDLQDHLAVTFGKSDKAAAEALGKAGIPGLKYYDGISRNAGEGTRNFVTWDQDVLNRMKLLERNGEKFSGLLAPNTITKSGASSDVLRKNGIWEISKISTPENMRGQGLASSELDRILKEADEAGVSVALTPSSDFGSSKKRLTDWYKKNGFVPNKGRNKDFSTRETMIRPAK